MRGRCGNWSRERGSFRCSAPSTSSPTGGSWPDGCVSTSARGPPSRRWSTGSRELDTFFGSQELHRYDASSPPSNPPVGRGGLLPDAPRRDRAAGGSAADQATADRILG